MVGLVWLFGIVAVMKLSTEVLAYVPYAEVFRYPHCENEI